MNKSAVRIPLFTVLCLLASATGAVTLNYQAVVPEGASDRAGFTMTISRQGVAVASHDRSKPSVVYLADSAELRLRLKMVNPSAPRARA